MKGLIEQDKSHGLAFKLVLSEEERTQEILRGASQNVSIFVGEDSLQKEGQAIAIEIQVKHQALVNT